MRRYRMAMNRLIMQAVALISALVLLVPRPAGADSLPHGVAQFDTSTSADISLAKYDTGFPTIAAAALGNYFWIGRDGGLRRYDRHSGDWEFIRYSGPACPGKGTINIIPDPPYVWSRLTNTGTLCRFDPRDSSWFTFDHWTVDTHRGQGNPMAFTADRIYYAAEGSPDWQGVNVIDRRSGEWIKLFESKPATSMYVNGNFVWVGVPAGILRINRITEEYTYYQPPEHGGGAVVKDIIPIPGAIAFATFGDRTGILGDKMRVSRKSFSVFDEKTGQWYSYQKSDRESLVRDIESGKVKYNFIKTNPGLLILRSDKWTLIDSKNGLDDSAINSIDKDEQNLYVASIKGINVLDINTLKPKDINLHIYRSLMAPRRIISDREYLWVLNYRGLFRIEKRSLFSAPR